MTPSCPTRRSSDLLRLPRRRIFPGRRRRPCCGEGGVPAVSGGGLLRPVLAALLLAVAIAAWPAHGQERILAYDSEVIVAADGSLDVTERSEEHTSELQSLMRISYAVFCLKK